MLVYDCGFDFVHLTLYYPKQFSLFQTLLWIYFYSNCVVVPLTSLYKTANFAYVKMSLAIKLFYYMHKKETPIFRYQQTTRVAGSRNSKKYCIFKMEKEFTVYDCKLLTYNL